MQIDFQVCAIISYKKLQFSVKTYNNLTMIGMIVYIKCGLLLKVIN